MNKLTNTLITIQILGLCIILFADRYWYRQHNDKFELTGNRSAVEQSAKIINRYVDSASRQHAVIKAESNLLSADWYKSGTAIKGGLLDTVAKALNIAKKQLLQVTQIATSSELRALKAERKVDSLQRVTYYHKNRYMQLTYKPPLPHADSTDHGEFDYSYNDSINVVQYWKRKWLFGSKVSYIDIFSSDPNTTVNGVKRLVVHQKEPVFGLRVQAVSNYSFSRGIINIGPGIQFDINRFSLVGTYYYDVSAQQFRPSLGARWDLIRF